MQGAQSNSAFEYSARKEVVASMFSNMQEKESGIEVFCWSRHRKDGAIEYAHGKPFHFYINK